MTACLFALFCFSSPNQNLPFIMKTKQGNGTITYEGYCINLLNELARVLKFTYEIYYSPDGMFGGLNENGTWNGMIGELVSKVCVIVGCSCYLSGSREVRVERACFLFTPCSALANWQSKNGCFKCPGASFSKHATTILTQEVFSIHFYVMVVAFNVKTFRPCNLFRNVPFSSLVHDLDRSTPTLMHS